MFGMKKTLKIQLGGLLAALLLLLSSGVAAAATGPAPAPDGSSFDQRLAQRKAERGVVLSQEDQLRLVEQCVNAQGKLRLIQHDDTSMLANRTNVYKKVDARLWIVTGQLKLADQDTFPLEKQRLTVVDQAAAFKVLSNNYEQAIDDALVVNCKADPVGFKALIDTVRSYSDLLKKQSGDIHDFVVNTIKSTLAGHISALQPKNDATRND
jgi:hypothetical protein